MHDDNKPIFKDTETILKVQKQCYPNTYLFFIFVGIQDSKTDPL